MQQFREGEFISVESDTHGVETGMVTQYCRRGESELLFGVVHVKSGNLISMKQTKIHANRKILNISEVATECSTSCDSGSHSGKSSSIGLAEMLPVFKKFDETFFIARGKRVTPFIGRLESRYSSNSLLSIARRLVNSNYIMMHRRKNADLECVDLVEVLRDAFKRRSEGVWMNPLITLAAVKSMGLPSAYFKLGRRIVPEYNQCIIHVDGSDSARTLGMHKDRDASDVEVHTILGCVSGHNGYGKEVIVWGPKTVERMPKWWRNEGLGREAFALAKEQCTEDAFFHHIRPGQFIFIPKGVWHWACPHPEAQWTVMVTSSFY